MSVRVESPLQPADLQRRLAAADPAALLIEPRLLRRVLRHHARAAGFGLLLPHRNSYTLDSTALLALVDRAELGLSPDQPLPPKVILLPQPDPEELAAGPHGALLVRCWRGLFHARIHLALDQKAAACKLTDADVRDRIQRIGQTEFDEIRTVLRQEKALLPPGDDRTVYTEFVAFALELRFFDPTHLHDCFPAVADWKDVDTLLAEEVDAEPLFAATRPQGAPEPEVSHTEGGDADEDEGPAAADGQAVTPPGEDSARLLRNEADVAAGCGNLVRAALLHARAAGLGKAEARADLNRLVERLRPALDLADASAAALRRALPPLLARAAAGGWTVEARLLYDLQKACVDHERGIFSVNVLGWAATLGRRPLKQTRPGEQAVLIYRNVRAAAYKAGRAHVEGRERRRLVTALKGVLRLMGGQLRDHFRPLLETCFERVGLVPANLPERVARAKLIEELLDRIDGKGFLTMGDVRDALSRNQLKLSDLTGPGEWLSGDPLLRLNRALAGALDGVYRPGEIYLRALQRVSAFAFGTAFGRLLVLYLLLPFGVAFLGLKGTDLLAEEAIKVGGLLSGQAHASGHSEAGAPHAHHHHPTFVATPWAVAGLGVFLLLLINVPAFRRGVFAGLRAFVLGLRTVFVDAPVWVARSPAVRAVLTSRPLTVFRRYLLAPLLLGGLVAGLLLGLGADAVTAAWSGGTVFALVLALLSTRFGRDLQEVVVDRFMRFWQRVTTDLILGLFHWVMQISRRVLEAIDRLLYGVDERLRFRTGESRLTLVLKGLAGAVWGAFAYVVRIYTNLLVEPTVNPIKHFPVVTVGHKLMLPFLIPLFKFLEGNLSFLGPVVGSGVVGLTLFFLPGMFGFMAWEFKENWKLYRANRAAALRPVVIGSHGETMLRLLRPGFHSGTVPKLFGKLRRAERHGRERAAHRYHEALHHAEEGIRALVEREFFYLLAHSKAWGGLRLALGEVGLATNRVRLELVCPDLLGGPVEILFDYCAGWLVAGVHAAGGLAQLTGPQRAAFATALAGLYKRAGVDLTREQIAAALAPAAPPYHITSCGLVVWPGADGRAEVVYPLRDGVLCQPCDMDGTPFAELPPRERDRLLFRETPVLWPQWVEAWQRDQSCEGVPEIAAGIGILPAAPPSAAVSAAAEGT